AFGIKNRVFSMHRGDILPAEALDRLKANPQAVLVDVRTAPEWAYVGVPAVERLLRLSWQVYPSMQTNLDFAKEIESAGLTKDTELLFICRSGARSGQAAAALSGIGYSNCWNVAQGFEGDRDAD